MWTLELPSRSAPRSAAAWLVALLLVAGCGGGGGGGGADTASAFTQGTINGFGSVIVNGVRFDDSRAQVVDDDDQPHSRGDLKLGMTVEIQSDRVRAASAGSGRHAEARHIRFGSELVGPAADIDVTGRTFKVLSQVVDVTDTTVFDDSLAGGLAALHAGDVVEVHALFDPTTQHYVAKRIEPKPDARFFKLRGVVSALTATTFKIGDAVVNYSGIAAAELPNNFADGLKVRVRLETMQNATNQWVAVTIRTGVRRVEDHGEAEVRGIVTDFTDIGSFSVNGLPVKTSATTKFPDGQAGIVKGAEVEVEGAIVDGVLVATKVELEGEHDDDDQDWRGNELHGTVADLNKDTQTFTVRGVKVHYTDATLFARGTVADLADGKAVEVRGKLAADGVTVEALSIKFES